MLKCEKINEYYEMQTDQLLTGMYIVPKMNGKEKFRNPK
jgi:hypothetical protein